MSLIERTAEALRLLEDLDLRTALVGGLPVSIRSEERFTRDIDFAVAVASDTDAEALALGFQRSGYTLHTVLEHPDRVLKRCSALRQPSRSPRRASSRFREPFEPNAAPATVRAG